MRLAIRALPWALLAASVTGNLYLVSRSPPAGRALLGVVEALGTDPELQHDPAVSSAPTPSGASVPDTSRNCAEAVSAAARIRELEQRLADLQANTFPHPRLVKEEFEVGPPNLLAESRLEPEIRRLLERDGGTLPWSLHCRGEVCRLQVPLTPADLAAWGQAVEALQSDPRMLSLSQATIFESGEPTIDAITGKDVLEQQVFVSLETEENAALREKFSTFLSALRKTSAVKDCTNGYEHHGLLRLKLQMGPDGNTQVILGGRLMMSPAAECLRARFQRETAAEPPGLPGRFYPVVMEFSSPPRE